MRALAALMLLAGPAAGADTLDCADPQTQTDMNVCAHLAFQIADEDLNAAYAVAIDQAKRIDGFAAEGGMVRPATTEETLRTAQRAWIVYRDSACSVESDLALGGSMAPMLYAGCREALTLERTEHLRYFGELK